MAAAKILLGLFIITAAILLLDTIDRYIKLEHLFGGILIIGTFLACSYIVGSFIL